MDRTSVPIVPADLAFERLMDLTLGECPIWDERRSVFWFVDILAPALLSFDLASRATTSHPMPCEIGSVGLTGDERLVVGLRSGVHLFDPRSGALEFLVHPEPDRTMNRLNDGRVGPDGCFWVGSMHDAVPRRSTGALYRIAPDGACERILDGLCVSNGLAWSPDGGRMYHADTRLADGGGEIRCYDVDKETGRLSDGRLFAALTEADGLPDGAAVDARGCYWSAGITAGCLNRFGPDGSLVERWRLPASAPTMPCFGGPDRTQLLLTSLTRNGDRGGLFAVAAPVDGLPEYRFGIGVQGR